MPTVSIRFDNSNEQKLLAAVKRRAKKSRRSLSNQIKWYLALAQSMEYNPDMSLNTIKGILKAKAEIAAGKAQPYTFRKEK